MAEFSFTYRAFISYSHADHDWGVWLHKALERYRVPRRLAGAAGLRRLGKVFRDEEEMAAAHEIGPKVEAALKASDALIVVCSPRSANSQWVNREIEIFKKLGREHRIFALIVDGTPLNTEDECFPAALKKTLTGDATDPFAPDVRKFGREDAVLRLIAGMLDIGYDDLRQREAQRARAERRRAGLLFASGLSLVSAVLIAGWLAAQNYLDSSERRAALFAREANALSDEGDYAKAMLVALADNARAQGGIIESLLRRDGYNPARAALERAYTHNRLIATLEAGAEVDSVAFAQDTAGVLTGLDNGTVKLWRIGEGRPIQEFSGHTGPILAMAVAPDGEHVLTGSEDRTAKLWRLGQDEPIRTFANQESGVGGVVFGADGVRVLTSSGWTARHWSISEVEPIETFLGAQMNPVFSIADTPDGVRALTVMWAERVAVWRIDSHEPIQTFMDQENGIFFASLTPDGSHALTASKDGTLRLWRLGDTKPKRTFAGHGGAISSAAFTPDGRNILAGSSDGSAMLWLVPEDKPTFAPSGRGPSATYTTVDRRGSGILPNLTLVGHADQVLSVAIASDGALALTGSKDRTAKVWRIQEEQQPLQSVATQSGLASVAFAPEAGRVLSEAWDGARKLWQMGQQDPIQLFTDQASSFGALAPDGKRVLIASAEGVATLWAVGEERPIAVFAGQDAVSAVAFATDGVHILIGSEDGKATLWRVGSSSPRQIFEGHDEGVVSVAIAPDGARLLTGSRDKTAKLWRTGSDRPVQTFGHNGWVNSVAFDSAGAKVLTGSEDGTAKFWAIGVREPVQTFLHSTPVNAVAFSPDGKRVLTASQDGSLSLWAVGQDKPIQTISHAGPVKSVAFSPDGAQVLTGSPDGVAKLWQIDPFLLLSPEEQITAACAKLAQIGVIAFSVRDRERFPILRGKLESPCADQ